MLNSSTGSSSFGIYEGLRILIPGYYLTFILWWFFQLTLRMTADYFPVEIPFVAFVLFGLIGGILLYATEGSKKRKAFRENQPSAYLLELSRTIGVQPPLEEKDAQHLYFFILNSYVPSSFHQRIFFFGMVFHVLTTIRRITLWIGIMSLGVILLHLTAGFPPKYDPAMAYFMCLSFALYLITLWYNKADRKMQENYQDQIQWLKLNQKLVLYILQHREAPISFAGRE